MHSRDPNLYFDRDLSWLRFNERVLYQAQDSRTPLLERVRFLSIFSSNLDEFFMKRIEKIKNYEASRIAQIQSEAVSSQ